MKNLAITLVIGLTTILSTHAVAQTAPVALNDTWQVEASDQKSQTPRAESSKKTEKKTTASSDSLEGCDAHIARVSRSAARKMLRALETKERISPLELGATVEVEVDGKRTSLIVFTEYERQVAALFTPGTKKSWVAAMTADGPIIARLDWTRSCTVSATQLTVPTGPEIAFEPFRYWGARVQWRLPENRMKGMSMIDAIRKAANE